MAHDHEGPCNHKPRSIEDSEARLGVTKEEMADRAVAAHLAETPLYCTAAEAHFVRGFLMDTIRAEDGMSPAWDDLIRDAFNRIDTPVPAEPVSVEVYVLLPGEQVPV